MLDHSVPCERSDNSVLFQEHSSLELQNSFECKRTERSVNLESTEQDLQSLNKSAFASLLKRRYGTNDRVPGQRADFAVRQQAFRLLEVYDRVERLPPK